MEENLELDCGVGVMLQLGKIPAGKFMMGSVTGEEEEQPCHEVTIQPLYVGIYPVTQAQYTAVVGENPSCFNNEPSSLRHPVEQVSFQDTKEFCLKLSKLSGQSVILPSEAQWEYVCKAGAPDHAEPRMESVSWYDDNSSGTTHPVGEKCPNAWGFFDMQGHVSEWCEDWWHNDYDGAPVDGSVWHKDSGSLRVVRGGSWFDAPWYCRPSSRGRMIPDARVNTFGFRVCVLPAN